MKRTFAVLALSLLLSVVTIGCSAPSETTTEASSVLSTTEISENTTKETEASDELLPFGFTPKEFHNNFSDFASLLDITTDSLKQISDTQFGFLAHSVTGNKITILLSTNSDGKVTIISIPTEEANEESFSNFVEMSILATDILLDYDELDQALDFSNIPVTANDFRHCTDQGISFTYNGNGIHIIRDNDTKNEYSYTKPPSDTKNNGKAKIDTTESNISSVVPNTEVKETLSEITIGQKNALNKAYDYLNYSPFSYSGLIKQLEYEGFSTEEATYAVKNCNADWHEQAAKKALDYLNYSAFSYSGLIKQLEYEGFSAEEAAFAVDNCGADWNEQAAQKAQNYLNYSSFSRSGLIKQLEYEGFTKEQSEYGVTKVGY